MQSNVLTLRRQAKQCLVYCVDAHKAFVEWDALLIELRQSILAKQNQTGTATAPADPSATAARHPEPDPSLSSIPFSHPILCGQTTLSDAIWEIMPRLEACFRRVYICITSSPGAMPDWAFLQSSRGRKYLTNLFLEADAIETNLSSQSMASGTDAYTIREASFPVCIAVSNPLSHCSLANIPSKSASSEVQSILPTRPTPPAVLLKSCKAGASSESCRETPGILGHPRG